ncbi:sensor histidine kinase [Actinomadura rubrisoli]|uniref:histidine kinase n=1 Tax=Actinomadura rubrisoli TaxID=2530368 RepID=A0A4R5BKT4_9ACTN|nr:sensor histidine kinase [Actinomadura rubrisoli]TDD85630.1 hypothetical protein E1298_18435 [Actinomadura rubrisoli]
MRADGDVGRWPRAADWGVPLLLACAQLSVTWLVTDKSGDPLGDRWTAAALVTGLSAVALLWRRIAPVPVLVATVLLSAFGIAVAGSSDAPIGGVADGVALYSLAVHRERRQAVIGCLAAFAVAFAADLPQSDGAGEVFTGALDGVTYLGITAFGQLRRQHKAMRSDLQARLARIGQENRAAAEAERERLARDVHDVAGHHLSAVAVHSGAAARRDDPELTSQALAVAAETGREVLKSLSGLVDVVSPRADGGLKALLPPLCQGLNRLGIPVSLAVEGRVRKLPAEVTTTAYRIVQESLTNVMRYASGAPVRVTVLYLPRTVEVSVENQAPADGGTVPALGTGRGIRGMRDRAARLGGDLSAGPAPLGGWSVVARLPTTTTSEYGGGWPEILDAVTIAFCVTLPMLGFVPPEPLISGWPLAELAPTMAVLAVRAAPLWWRRRAPYAALAALIVIDVIWVAVGALWSVDFLVLFALGCPAQLVAVYSVACYHRGNQWTWPAALLAPLPWSLVLGLALVMDPEFSADGPDPDAFIFGLVLAFLVTTPLTFAMWGWGTLAAIRSRRWGTTALDAATARTGEVVRAERSRVAAGLSATVLDRTARLVRAAEAGLAGTTGDARAALAVVADEARAALTDMRRLLDAMEEKT